MKQYRKTIGSLNYNTYNVPGSALTGVFIENDPKSYLFKPDYKEWDTMHDYAGTPELPAEQLAELEAALLKQCERRRKAIADQNEWNWRFSRIVANENNILEVSTVYKVSFFRNGVNAPKVGLTHHYDDNGGGWLSYTVAHGPDQVKQVRRRFLEAGSDPHSPESNQIRKRLEAEMERERTAEEKIIRSGTKETK